MRSSRSDSFRSHQYSPEAVLFLRAKMRLLLGINSRLVAVAWSRGDRMLSSLFLQASTVERVRGGPIGAHADAFARRLLRLGYDANTVRVYLSGAEHFGSWLLRHDRRLEEIGEETIAAFRRHLSRCRCRQAYRPTRAARTDNVVVGARHLLKHLRAEGTTPPRRIPELPPLMVEFSAWLRQRQDVGNKTVYDYSRHSGALLATVDSIERLGARAVRGFILAESRKYSRGYVKSVITAIRTFIRFLTATGRCASNLSDAVPKVAQWRLATLPKYIPYDDVERLIESCDPKTAVGLRDRAVLLLMGRLALRGGDVRALRLADIDWAAASIVVSGKTPREARLPLPQDVGEAVLAYVNGARPNVVSPFVFLSTKPPFGPLQSSVMSRAARSAIVRTGIKTPTQGSHLLRHSAATEMLRRGATLDQVRAVLRHASPETTLQYAKVDVQALREIAQPWPEVPPC